MHPDLAAALTEGGFIHLPAAATAALLPAPALAAWPDFAASWDGMALDRHMADGGRYRRRRHAVLAARAGQPGLVREADAPHYQARDHNPLNGGVQRWFEPVPPAVTAGPAFAGIANWARQAFDEAGGAQDWHVEAHQFRIEAAPGSEGRPTPEGMHRDGVDWVLVLLVRRENVDEGVTEIATPDGGRLGAFTLTDPLDAVLLDDHRILHGVTPVVPHDATRPAWRDVLVLTFRRRSAT
ncbi:2OG-Fe dioxygenase family protein [Falsiroseomonas selenitidurans]|uniref:2OG-Fe dioxygenase family protein n=1 Tax=Falsiroseomonas selenitidurans TaxID=2716335 RepID=A0ABX1EB83_9PROT|nr:2OG-Fe dioxygenase family protein [Falsiroseomonas selenitidurans]NKC34504.1 2OG-Fe dioxygenase family protein [Falsiroseomonas selenitidurans]